MTTEMSDLEILKSLRDGTVDYDFDAIPEDGIKEFGQGFIFEINSNIDGKTYVGKRLKYQIGSKSKFNTPQIQTQAEREMTLLRL